MRVLKKIIIFILVVAILGAGGFFGYRYYQQWKAAKEPVGDIQCVFQGGVLTIDGTGRMPNFSATEQDREWDQYKDQIDEVIIGNNITSVGKNAFMNYENLTTVTLGQSVELIDVNAFNGCENLTTINIPVSVKEVGESAFWDCNSLKNMTYEGMTEDWEEMKIGDNNIVLNPDNIWFEDDTVTADASTVVIEDPQDGSAATSATAVSMYRLSNSSTEELYYTTLDTERDALVASGWSYDGIMWRQPETSNTPIYRLTNPATGGHYYTIDWAQREACVAEGWAVDGVIGYSDDTMAVPVYRMRNPNAVIATHCYTVNTEEVANLEAAGWVNEGVAWYACS